MSSLASASSLLSEEEKELGLCLVDIGNASSDLIVYSEGGITYSASIPYAGQHISHDFIYWPKNSDSNRRNDQKNQRCCQR